MNLGNYNCIFKKYNCNTIVVYKYLERDSGGQGTYEGEGIVIITEMKADEKIVDHPSLQTGTLAVVVVMQRTRREEPE